MIRKSETGGAARKLPVVTQTSAGGVVYKRTGESVLVAIVSVGDANRWQLPKGLVEKGETPENAALRETREEAGIEGEIEAPLETIEYWYAGMHEGRKVRFHKFVHFFLLRYKSGEVAGHDWEVNESRWVPLDEAISMVAFKSEKSILERGAKLLSM
jgi:8-oxo-dGTP pyrophosphatase MutT (NUDIX family)